MKPLYVALAVLLLAGVITTTVVLLLKRHKPLGPVGSPGNWSAQQKSDVLSKTETSFGQALNTCLVNNLSAKYSYSTVSDPNFNPSDADMKAIMSPCFGQKGAWSPDFKTYLVSQITSNIPSGTPQACVPCIINTLQNTFDPTDLMDLMNAPKPPPGTTPPDPVGDALKASCSSQCSGHTEGFREEGFRRKAQQQGYCGSCRR